MRKLYAIGDVHGCWDALTKLLVKIGEDKGDDEATIVFIGDYVDRGPKSAEVVDLLRRLQNFSETPSRKTRYVFLRGNHEDMMLSGDARRHSGFWLPNGGVQTLDSYRGTYGEDEWEKRWEDDCRWIDENTVWWHREKSGDDDYLFVHGGMNPAVKLDELEEYKDALIWERNYNKYDGDYDQGIKLVHGHTPIERPLVLRRQLNIDTGCVFGKSYSEYGNLTAAVLHEGWENVRFIQTRDTELLQ